MHVFWRPIGSGEGLAFEKPLVQAATLQVWIGRNGLMYSPLGVRDIVLAVPLVPFTYLGLHAWPLETGG